MEILFLGTGGCIPTTKKPNRSYAGFYIQAGSDGLMFDIGPGSIAKLNQSGVDINKMPTHLFVTHLHPDHSADFVGLMQGRALNRTWYQDRTKLQLYGGEGITRFTKDIFENVTAWRSFREELIAHETIDVHEVEEGIIAKTDVWCVAAKKVKHFNSRAFRLEFNGKVMAYTGDMGYDDNFAELARDADIAILECSFPDKESLKGTHLCPEDIGKLAKLGNFKHVVLTHMYPECEGREEEMTDKIHEFAEAPVTIAHDLLKIVS